MALQSFNEIAGRGVDGGEDMNRTYRKKFQVVSNAMNEDAAAVRAYALTQIPLFTPFPTDGGSLLVGVAADQDEENPFLWTATLRWSALTLTSRSSNAARSDPAQRNENPLARPPRVRLTTERFQIAPDYDFDGNPVMNSAKDRFSDAVLRWVSRPVVTISRNKTTFPTVAWRNWINTVNKTSFLGFEPGEAMLVDLNDDRQFEGNVYFHEVTGVWHIAQGFDRFTWQPHVLDAGYQEIVAGKKQKIMLPGGVEPSSPVRLNGSGRRLAPDDAAPNASQFVDFTFYDEAEHNDLGLI